MDWLQFVASVIGSLAWPGVVLAAVILLRRPLAELLPFLHRLKYKDFEVEFDREVRKLREEAALALPPLPRSVSSKLPEETALLELASVAPREAVIEAWLLVESSARRAVETGGSITEPGQPLTGPQLTWALMDKGLIDTATRAVFDRLRMLRTQAVHVQKFAISKASARDYVELALEFARRLEVDVR